MIKPQGHEGSGAHSHAVFTNDHRRLTDAGWTYRMHHSHGWIAYRDGKTGRWYTQKDALAILESGEAKPTVS